MIHFIGFCQMIQQRTFGMAEGTIPCHIWIRPRNRTLVLPPISALMDKPSLIVVAESIHPRLGSEPGKGWWWSCALSAYYRLHVITTPQAAELCRNEEIPSKDQWIFHHPVTKIEDWAFPRGYIQYGRWLEEALAIAGNIRDRKRIDGLCHVNIGSFRVLPRYDLLGIPYALGPLGGGERSPFRMLAGRKIPFSHRCSEMIRPVLNNSFAPASFTEKNHEGRFPRVGHIP